MGYKYQLGVDDSVIYDTVAGSAVITLTGSSHISGNTLYPWIYAVGSNQWHFADLDSATSASITVSPVIALTSESLVINYNGPQTSLVPSGSVTSSAGSVVYGSGTDGNAHPIGATQNPDGTWSLQTDTELILSGDLIVSNVKVFSVDGTSGSLVYGLAAPNGTLFVTSSLTNPVWVSISGSSGGSTTVTSSCTSPIWATLASGCFTASIDSYSDLHVYDTRVSGSIITGSIIISGSVKANSDLVVSTAALISGSIVANTNAVLAASGSTVNTTNAVLAASGSIVANTNATLAAEALTSGSIVAFASESFNENRINILYSMFPYQLGVDEGVITNAASSTTVNITGTPSVTGSTLCPWIYNATNLTWHYADLATVTSSSFTVSPAIGAATASLVIRFNKPKKGYGPITWISESNGAMGLTTSSDIPMLSYSNCTIQFSRVNAVTASLSATISSDTSPSIVDYYSITEALYGSSLINSDCYLTNFENIKATALRLNYYKTNATNGCVVRYWLWT